MISKEKRQFVPFLLDNSSISVEGHVDSLWLAKVAGGANDQLAEAKVIAKSNSEELKQLETEYREASQNNDHKAVEAVIERYNASEKAQADKLVDYIKAHSKSKAAPYIFAQLIQPKTRDNHKLWKKVIAMMDTSLHSNPKIVQTSERIKLLESLSEGQIAPEFSQNDKDGKPVKLSSFRGKPLLIDFWASWCGPCRRANPKVVATYKKYKDQGFQVLGVSLDENKEKWLQAVEKDGLVWTHVSDLKGWGNEAAKLYGVQSIPHTVLIDAEGRIAGKNLHGEELEKKIEELLPNS